MFSVFNQGRLALGAGASMSISEWKAKALSVMLTSEILEIVALLGLSVVLMGLFKKIKIEKSIHILFILFVVMSVVSSLLEIYIVRYPIHAWVELAKSVMALTAIMLSVRLLKAFPNIKHWSERALAAEAYRDQLESKNRDLEKTNEKLVASEGRFHAMARSIRLGAIFTVDLAGKIMSWNEGAQNLFGYTEAEVGGKSAAILDFPQENSNMRLEQALHQARIDGTFQQECTRFHKNGTSFWANIILAPLYNSENKHIGYSYLTRDLSERKAAEEKLRKAYDEMEKCVLERTSQLQSALQSRDEFLSVASHELKTPLAFLNLQLQIAARELSAETFDRINFENIRKSFPRALRQVKFLTELVDELLDVTRIQAGRLHIQPEKMNLAEVVREVAEDFAEDIRQAKSQLSLDFEGDLNGTWDRFRIEQVVTNLVSNAVKYAPASEIGVQVRRIGSNVEIVVWDSGPGIPVGEEHKIFDRFERIGSSQAKPGLGLGLYIVRQIVSAHSGKIAVKSRNGGGAKFTIRLPLEVEIPKLQQRGADATTGVRVVHAELYGEAASPKAMGLG